MSELIPIVPARSLLGHLHTYVADPIGFLSKAEQQHGKIFRFRLAHRYLIATFDPEHIRQVMQENHTNYIKSIAYRKLRVLLGEGLFTSEGSFWLRQRRLAQPAFHREKLKHYQDLMTEESQHMTARWQSDPAAVDLQKDITDLTMRVITRCLLGIQSGHQQHQAVEKHLPYTLEFMIRRITSTLNWPLSFPFPTYNKFHHSVKEMNATIENLIAEKRKNLRPKNTDLLSMLMQIKDEDTGESMSDQQLRDEVITFFLAGHETSAMTLTWALYLLAAHPEVQQKAREDAQNPQGGQYIRQVLKETMRLFAPVWILGREALADDNFQHIPIKKGNSIIFSPYIIHRHPDYWEKPDEFNPDRFTPEKEAQLHKFVYFPFGGGPRLCIGQQFALMEMHIILSDILRKFKLVCTGEHPGYTFSLTLRPGKAIPVKLQHWDMD